MSADQPGLFDPPDLDPPRLAERSHRGRNRETWARTVTAEVDVIDPAALEEAVALAEVRAFTIEMGLDPDGAERGVVRPAASDDLDRLARLIWPTEGLEELLEAGAVRVTSVSIEAVAKAASRGTFTWTVTVTLTDVHALRRMAAQRHPEAAGPIVESLATAWQHAADPFAPLRALPGITWRPGPVDVQHLPRRSRPGSAG